MDVWETDQQINMYYEIIENWWFSSRRILAPFAGEHFSSPIARCLIQNRNSLTHKIIKMNDSRSNSDRVSQRNYNSISVLKFNCARRTTQTWKIFSLGMEWHNNEAFYGRYRWIFSSDLMFTDYLVQVFAVRSFHFLLSSIWIWKKTWNVRMHLWKGENVVNMFNCSYWCSIFIYDLSLFDALHWGHQVLGCILLQQMKRKMKFRIF